MCPAAKTTDETTAQVQKGNTFMAFPAREPRKAISSPNAVMITWPITSRKKNQNYNKSKENNHRNIHQKRIKFVFYDLLPLHPITKNSYPHTQGIAVFLFMRIYISRRRNWNNSSCV
jgi:hypothetical protein